MCKPIQRERIIVHFEGKAIDVNDWTKYHPGGAKILKIFHERDCTAQCYATHSKQAMNMMRARANKSKREVPGPSKIDAEYLEMRERYEKMGYFKVDKWVIMENVLKNLAVLVPFIYGFYLIYLNTNPWASVALIGWAMYYAGWVGHDYSHHQWAPTNNSASARFCDWMAGLHGGLIRGNGALWWKRRHNTHHVVTNEVGNDPDIKTNPALIFSEHFEIKWFNKLQHLYFMPLLSLLDFYWHVESWETTIKHGFLRPKNVREATVARRDAIFMLAFDALFIFWIYTQGFFYPFLCLWISGAATATVVFTTHYAEERLEKDHNMSFAEQTCRTSRNISGFFGEDVLWSFLTNNLSLQKEHHLFPRMSNVYLRQVRHDVRPWVESHGWEYSEDNIVQCMRNLYDLLKKTAY